MDDNFIIIAQTILVVIFILFVVTSINEDQSSFLDFFRNENIVSKKVLITNNLKRDILIGKTIIKSKKSDTVVLEKDSSHIDIKIRGIDSQRVILNPGQNSIVVGKITTRSDDSSLTINRHPHTINNLYIENFLNSKIVLEIAGTIVEIDPFSSIIHKGKYDNGIPIGSVIKNTNGIFSEIKICENITHLVYTLI